MDAADVVWLQSPEGARAVEVAAAALGGGASELAVVDRLRREYPPEHARAALALVLGRRAVASKVPDAGRLFADREAAEQASPAPVARHTASRFAGAQRVADLGCGMGADTLALAEHAPVLAVDLDGGRVAMTAANAAVRGLEARVETLEVDVMSLTLPAGVDAAWCDPSRRDSTGRVLDPARWSPPLEVAVRLVGSVGGGIKLAPGIDAALLPGGSELEFVSLDGRLVEAVLWLGRFASASRRATVLTEEGEAASLAGEPDDVAGGTATLGEPGRYLYDLDPAVGRAGLVRLLAARLGAWQLDEATAYLSADEAAPTPFARRFRVEGWLPFSERRLVERLRALGAPRVEVMRRASPVDTNALEVRLNAALAGGPGEVVTVALTRVGGAHVAILARRERAEPQPR